MKRIFRRAILYGLLLFEIIFSKNAFSEYIEGIDTTDVNGYGMDSAFYVRGDTVYGQKIGSYYFHWYEGYFNYSFDEIKLVPKTRGSLWPITNSCFVIKSNKDSTVSKVQVLKQISGKRYLYRYGTNTTPNDSLLERSDYDRSVLYKPNNVHENYEYRIYDSLLWDPPLPNNNHLIGYIVYKSQAGHAPFIDTTAPVDLWDWDSLSLGPTTRFLGFVSWLNPCPTYFNIVAVYTEGKSDLLKGWTCLLDIPVNAKNYSIVNKKSPEGIILRKFPDGYLFNFTFLPSFISINNISGRQISRFSGKSNYIFWNTSESNISPGLYIINAELPDKTVYTQPFIYRK